MNQIQIQVVRPFQYPMGTDLHAMEGEYFQEKDYETCVSKAQGKYPGEILAVRVSARFDSNSEPEPLEIGDDEYERHLPSQRKLKLVLRIGDDVRTLDLPND